MLFSWFVRSSRSNMRLILKHTDFLTRHNPTRHHQSRGISLSRRTSLCHILDHETTMALEAICPQCGTDSYPIRNVQRRDDLPVRTLSALNGLSLTKRNAAAIPWTQAKTFALSASDLLRSCQWSQLKLWHRLTSLCASCGHCLQFIETSKDWYNHFDN